MENSRIISPDFRGIIYDLSNEDYHASHDFISKSGLDKIDITPGHYQAYITEPHEETTTFFNGTLIHAAILEPDEIETRYFATSEKPDKRTKAGKVRAEEIKLEAGDKLVVMPNELEMIKRISENIHIHPIASQLFSGGLSEVSIFGELEGANVRTRNDYLNVGINAIVDLKSSEKADKASFIRSIERYRYDVQDAFYTDNSIGQGLDIENFLFVVVEKSSPFRVEVYELDNDSKSIGRIAYQNNLITYQKCVNSGFWPCSTNMVNKIETSIYHRKAVSNRIESADW